MGINRDTDNCVNVLFTPELLSSRFLLHRHASRNVGWIVLHCYDGIDSRRRNTYTRTDVTQKAQFCYTVHNGWELCVHVHT